MPTIWLPIWSLRLSGSPASAITKSLACWLGSTIACSRAFRSPARLLFRDVHPSPPPRSPTMMIEKVAAAAPTRAGRSSTRRSTWASTSSPAMESVVTVQAACLMPPRGRMAPWLCSATIRPSALFNCTPYRNSMSTSTWAVNSPTAPSTSSLVPRPTRGTAPSASATPVAGRKRFRLPVHPLHPTSTAFPLVSAAEPDSFPARWEAARETSAE